MAEQRSYTGSFNNRWKFTGKELNEETGLYYFGARFYNPVTSLWLSVDPLVEETMDAYGYVHQNPITMVDPDGKFPIPVHTKMIDLAFKNLNIFSALFGFFKRDIKYGAGLIADIKYMNKASVHFDGLENHNQIQARWKELNTIIRNNINNIDTLNISFGGPDAIKLGTDMHSVADFYAHSNYVELFVEYYMGVNNLTTIPLGIENMDIPTYNEGIKIPEFKALMDRTTRDKEGNYQGLRTGSFELTDNEKLSPGVDFGPDSHQKMNKDDVSTPRGKMAIKVAQKHVELYLRHLPKDQ
jgi:RHS repeat-associated protein